MKKSASLLISILIGVQCMAQSATDISGLAKLCSNDINNKCKMVPLELRDKNDTTCNTFYGLVGMAVITTPLVSKFDEEGKRYNEKETQYQCRIHVSYDCQEYKITLYDEPIIMRVDKIENLNEKQATKSVVVIESDGVFMPENFNYATLTTLTKQRLQEIGETVMPQAQKMYKKILKE